MLAANQAYLISIGVPQDRHQKCLEAMEKYNHDQWWLSNDPKKRAYCQTNEPVLLYKDVSLFREDLCILLNRKIIAYEMFGVGFHQEVERAWKYGVGATSDRERKERFEESVQKLKDMGNEVQIFELPSEDCN